MFDEKAIRKYKKNINSESLIRPMADIEILEDLAMSTYLSETDKQRDQVLISWAPYRKQLNKDVAKHIGSGLTREASLRQIIEDRLDTDEDEDE